MKLKPLPVIVLGLGPIGRAVAKEIAGQPDMELMGAVDPAPKFAGKSVGELIRDKSRARLRVHKNLPAQIKALGRRRPTLAVHMATSRFPEAYPQILELVKQGVSVVSTCEEMVAAPDRWPKEAHALDRACRKAGVSVLSAGVNPGFVMDFLPEVLSSVCVRLDSVRITRHVDTAKRRRALQLKTGAGITVEEFRARKRAGTIGHVGCLDSLLFVLRHLRLPPQTMKADAELLRPIIAGKAVGTGRNRIPKGRVVGVHQTVRGRDSATGKIVATLDLKMAYGLEDPHDAIFLKGDPPVDLRIDGGIQGDRATVGTVLSTIRDAAYAPPGFGG
ncbi:MAG: hypothetical protein QGI43_03225 [Gemmatimonadota bacterium]|jgi:4-hydroxy-tetrahydrodipicolinate reductase|nr:hypothetical protein [Gemmatimonadota bacterium]MDP6528685.1 hypothetical protein [Gemmatimonadota bacterium]MDP7031688.1 hypothetical protein [Gemmatimonadota bacterium]